MSVRAPSLAAAAVAFGAAVACSFAVSVDGLRGGAGVDASVDGPAAPPSDSGVVDARADAAVDAAPDAAKTYCEAKSPAAKLCVAFSKGRTHSSGAQLADEMDGEHFDSAAKAATLDGALFTSAPMAAAFELQGYQSFLTRDYDSTPTSFTFGASIRFETDEFPAATDTLEARLTDATYAVYLRVSSGGSARVVYAYPSDGGSRSTQSIPIPGALATRRWYRFDISVHTGSVAGIDVRQDGELVASTPLAATYGTKGSLRLIAGSTELVDPRPGRFLVDDFAADW